MVSLLTFKILSTNRELETADLDVDYSSISKLKQIRQK